MEIALNLAAQIVDASHAVGATPAGLAWRLTRQSVPITAHDADLLVTAFADFPPAPPMAYDWFRKDLEALGIHAWMRADLRAVARHGALAVEVALDRRLLRFEDETDRAWVIDGFVRHARGERPPAHDWYRYDLRRLGVTQDVESALIAEMLRTRSATRRGCAARVDDLHFGLQPLERDWIVEGVLRQAAGLERFVWGRFPTPPAAPTEWAYDAILDAARANQLDLVGRLVDEHLPPMWAEERAWSIDWLHQYAAGHRPPIWPWSSDSSAPASTPRDPRSRR